MGNSQKYNKKNGRYMAKLFSPAILLLICFSNFCYAVSIKYDINTTDLANLGATVIPTGGHPDGTHNGVTYGISGPSGSLWHSYPKVGEDNYIAWMFVSGSSGTNRIQLINDGDPNHDHHLIHFSLEYTTDLNPTLLGSNYQALNIIDTIGFEADINGNEIFVTTPTNDLDIAYSAVSATAIRLHTYPYAGNHVGNGSDGNFILNEVSFSSVAVSEPSTLALILVMVGFLGTAVTKKR